MEDCIFCKIITGEIPADIVYRDNDIIAFRDINPVAPTHLLIIPCKHIISLTEMPEADFSIVDKMLRIANRLAEEEQIAESGYRLAINCGKHGGQEVLHLHLHLIGGRQLSGRLG